MPLGTYTVWNYCLPTQVKLYVYIFCRENGQIVIFLVILNRKYTSSPDVFVLNWKTIKCRIGLGCYDSRHVIAIEEGNFTQKCPTYVCTYLKRRRLRAGLLKNNWLDLQPDICHIQSGRPWSLMNIDRGGFLYTFCHLLLTAGSLFGCLIMCFKYCSKCGGGICYSKLIQLSCNFQGTSTRSDFYVIQAY